MQTPKVLFFLIVLTIYSCSEEKSNFSEQDDALNYDECLKSFNVMFSNVDFKDSFTYQFDSIRAIKPNFMRRFYSKKELDKYAFFNLSNSVGSIRIAINLKGGDNHHEVYFIEPFNDYEIIDESEYLITNLSFLNECGYKIYDVDLKKESYGWLTNTFDERYIGKFELSNTLECDDSHKDLNSIELTKNMVIIEKSDTLKYLKQGRDIISYSDSIVLFNLIGYSNQNLLVRYDNCILLYSKN
jgi:hypothetical protein